MSDQFPMFVQTISEGTRSATSSPELESGLTHSGLLDGKTTAKSGREAVPANPSARLAKAKRSTKKGIFGQSGLNLSNGAGQPSYSENRSHQPPLLAELLMKSKTCKKCGIEQPYSAYYVNSKGHRRTTCMTCIKDHSRLDKRQNPERTKAAFRSWRALNRGRALVTVARFRARQKGIPFDLDANEVQARIDGGACELTGIPFDLSTPKAWNAPSLDQIIPGAGYTTTNVRVVLYSVNVMANAWGHGRILEVAKAILDRRKERSNAFSRKLAEKLKETTDRLGSTLFTLTWQEHITPSGHVIPRLVASEAPTEDSVCIGWPTPDAQAFNVGADPQKHQERLDRLKEKHGNGNGAGATLDFAAGLSSWPTPRGKHATGNPERATDCMARLEDTVFLSAWGTPATRDWKSGDASQQTLNKNARPLNELAMLAGWPTPMAGTPAQKGYNEAGNSDSSRKTVEMCQWPVDPSMISGETPIGFLLGPNGWEIVPASGQLNAAHSRWLMGLPPVWDACGVTAMESLRKRRKHS